MAELISYRKPESRAGRGDDIDHWVLRVAVERCN